MALCCPVAVKPSEEIVHSEVGEQHRKECQHCKPMKEHRTIEVAQRPAVESCGIDKHGDKRPDNPAHGENQRQIGESRDVAGNHELMGKLRQCTVACHAGDGDHKE